MDYKPADRVDRMILASKSNHPRDRSPINSISVWSPLLVVAVVRWQGLIWQLEIDVGVEALQ
jgi:hypothetical protein